MRASTSRQNQLTTNKINRPGRRADGLALLLSALRPGFFKIILALFVIYFCQNVYVTNVSAASVTLTLPAAISLNVSPNSTLTKSSASSFSVKTDGPWGYNLSIKAKSTTDMVNGSAKIPTISKTMPESEYTAAGNNNTWGFIPSKLNNNANSNFVAATTSAMTIEKTSAANASTANNYSITLGAKVDSTIKAGTYSNTFVFTATANAVNYSITYNLNSGSWSGTSPQTGSTTANSITLDSHTPTKSNYTFEGWCSSSNITNNNTTSTPTCAGGGTKYNAGGTYKLSNSSNTVTLYAMWRQNGTSYNIAYNCDSGTPCPSTQSGTTTDSNVTLSSTTPSKSGYNFQGWCSTSPSSNNSSSVSCSGDTYQPNGSYPLSRGASVTLYAMWKKNGPTNGDSCSHSGYSGTAKYYGGYCWMWSDYRTVESWFIANSSCPSGWHLPSKDEFQDLLYAIGTGSRLYDAGWYGFYWSSTGGSNSYYYLNVYVSSASIDCYGEFGSYNSGNVRCVSN